MIEKFYAYIASARAVLAVVWADADRFIKVRTAFVLMTVVAGAVATAFGPFFMKLIVDGFTGHAKGAAVSGFLLVGLYIFCEWAARILSQLQGWIHARAERRMFRSLSERLFSHIMRLPLRYHLDRHTGAISQALQNGMQGYQMVLQVLVFTILPVIVQLATIVVILAKLDQAVFLALFSAAIVCYAAAFAYTAINITEPAKSAATAQIDATASMTDTLLNYETVKYFTAEAVVQKQVSDALILTENETVRFYRRVALNGMGIGTIFASFLATTILYATHAVYNGQMTVGEFVLVNTYILQIVQPVETLGGALRALTQGLALLERVIDIFREKAEPTHITLSTARSGPARLDFENVGLAYRSDRPILRDINFSLPSGKTLGIVGPSGAGKSTLVRLLVRLIEPDEGRILLDGVPISQIPLATLRQSIAVVPQDTVLFNQTIGYNIGFGKPGCTQKEIEHAARLAHLHDFVMSLPDGYDTRVGERGVKLSGGEKQRVSIARAAIKAPRIYVFDEATSSLDSRTEREILRNLREISRRSTTLVIAHRLSTVTHADEIVVLEDGAFVERGTHASLLRLDGRYAALWQAQQANAGNQGVSAA